MSSAAIINFWDGEELLPYCIDNWLKCVDAVIVVYSNQSNHMNMRDNTVMAVNTERVYWIQKEPNLLLTPMQNEREKRNFGLDAARNMGFQFFVMSDCDEFYESDKFEQELTRFNDHKLQGLVCGSQVYFKSPQLTIGMDRTRVAFIHRITPTLNFQFNRHYPFAWEGHDIFIDPTRQLNINSGVMWSDIICHHYSYVRKDIEVKIQNSTAKTNIERSTIRQDYLSAKEGSFIKFYGKSLVRAQVDFKIPECFN